jgi:hypothetical protein
MANGEWIEWKRSRSRSRSRRSTGEIESGNCDRLHDDGKIKNTSKAMAMAAGITERAFLLLLQTSASELKWELTHVGFLIDIKN